MESNLVEHFTNAVLDGVFVGTMFGIHREFTINKLVGLRDLDAQQQDGEGETEGRHIGRRSSIADSLRNKSIECRCFVCHRMIAAVRFAPHLEKCIGIGRNSRARRRGNNPSSSHENATVVRAIRSATLRSATKANNFDGLALEHPLASSGGMHFAAEEQDKMKEEIEGEEESMKDRLRNKQQQNNGTTITANRHPNWRIVKR